MYSFQLFCHVSWPIQLMICKGEMLVNIINVKDRYSCHKDSLKIDLKLNFKKKIKKEMKVRQDKVTQKAHIQTRYKKKRKR